MVCKNGVKLGDSGWDFLAHGLLPEAPGGQERADCRWRKSRRIRAFLPDRYVRPRVAGLDALTILG